MNYDFQIIEKAKNGLSALQSNNFLKFEKIETVFHKKVNRIKYNGFRVLYNENPSRTHRKILYMYAKIKQTNKKGNKGPKSAIYEAMCSSGHH